MISPSAARALSHVTRYVVSPVSPLLARKSFGCERERKRVDGWGRRESSQLLWGWIDPRRRRSLACASVRDPSRGHDLWPSCRLYQLLSPSTTASLVCWVFCFLESVNRLFVWSWNNCRLLWCRPTMLMVAGEVAGECAITWWNRWYLPNRRDTARWAGAAVETITKAKMDRRSRTASRIRRRGPNPLRCWQSSRFRQLLPPIRQREEHHPTAAAAVTRRRIRLRASHRDLLAPNRPPLQCQTVLVLCRISSPWLMAKDPFWPTSLWIVPVLYSLNREEVVVVVPPYTVEGPNTSPPTNRSCRFGIHSSSRRNSSSRPWISIWLQILATLIPSILFRRPLLSRNTNTSQCPSSNRPHLHRCHPCHSSRLFTQSPWNLPRSIHLGFQQSRPSLPVSPSTWAWIRCPGPCPRSFPPTTPSSPSCRLATNSTNFSNRNRTLPAIRSCCRLLRPLVLRRRSTLQCSEWNLEWRPIWSSWKT